jgi:hypothetical protein
MGLHNKFSKFYESVYAQDCKIICVTETYHCIKNLVILLELKPYFHNHVDYIFHEASKC